MKVGDKIDVIVSGQTVAQAEIKEVGEGTATLIVPATRVVMATKTELTVESPETDTSGTQTIVDEVVRQPVETPVAPVAAEQSQDESVPAEQSSTPEAKVITSSSVPVPNQPSLASLDPVLQAKIMEVVASHNSTDEKSDDGQHNES